jgi:hypothetical protein
MSHLAIIISIAGDERYLARDRSQHPETSEKKGARRFRSAGAAIAAARAHLDTFTPFIAGKMAFRAEPTEEVES